MTRVPFDPDGDSRWTRLIRRIIRKAAGYGAQHGGDYYTTINQRPIMADGVNLQPDVSADSEKYAVVIQGPIVAEDDFTLETVKLYQKHFLGSRIYFSTWNDTDEEQLRPFRDLGVELVLSEKPEKPALFNLNMQLVGSGNGVKKAVADGATWILKTRPDQRLYYPDALVFLRGLATQFPVNGNWDQKYRIVAVGHGTLKFTPYHVTDQTVFGHADDMLKYWTPPLRVEDAPAHWPKNLNDIHLNLPIRENSKAAAETYITSSFLASVGRPLKWTVEDGWAALKDHFCVADYAMTDFFWWKVQTNTYLENTKRYDCLTTRNEVSFGDWLLLYSGSIPLDRASVYEHVLDLCYTEMVEPK